MKKIFYFYKKVKYLLIFNIFLIILSAFFSISSYAILGNVINQISGQFYPKNLDNFLIWISVFIIFVLMNFIISNFNSYFEEKLLIKLSLLIKRDLVFNWINNSNKNLFYENSDKKFHVYNNEVNLVINNLYYNQWNILRTFVLSFYSLVIVFIFFWGFGLFVVLSSILIVLIPFIFSKLSIRFSNKYQKNYAKHNSNLKRILQNFEIFRNNNKIETSILLFQKTFLNFIMIHYHI